ncbi:MAG: hypothetical protein GY807_06875 [Gammaproteobacteria bacterium]|nr:hypothetical protein [Gammaproteobacteria bacterium]
MADNSERDTIEHDQYELAPEVRRRSSRSTFFFIVAVALAWAGLWYFKGWAGFDWVQISLGFITATALWGWCWENIPRNKPYKDI